MKINKFEEIKLRNKEYDNIKQLIFNYYNDSKFNLFTSQDCKEKLNNLYLVHFQHVLKAFNIMNNNENNQSHDLIDHSNYVIVQKSLNSFIQELFRFLRLYFNDENKQFEDELKFQFENDNIKDQDFKLFENNKDLNCQNYILQEVFQFLKDLNELDQDGQIEHHQYLDTITSDLISLIIELELNYNLSNQKLMIEISDS